MFGMLKGLFGEGEVAFVSKPDGGSLSAMAKEMLGNGAYTKAGSRLGGYDMRQLYQRGHPWNLYITHTRTYRSDSYGWNPSASSAGSQARAYVAQLAKWKVYEEWRQKNAGAKELALQSKLSDLQTASEMAIQQANIERAAWLRQKEQLERGMLEAKLKREELLTQQAERDAGEVALKSAQASAEQEKKAKQKSMIKKGAIVAGALAILSQVA